MSGINYDPPDFGVLRDPCADAIATRDRRIAELEGALRELTGWVLAATDATERHPKIIKAQSALRGGDGGG